METKALILICTLTKILADCGFQQGLCGWINDKTQNGDWRIGRGQTLNGPMVDHSFSNDQGGYLYMGRSSGQPTGAKALLVSSAYQPTAPRCFSFWFYMHDAMGGSLVVYLRHENQTQPEIWRLSGDQGDSWKYASVTIQSNNGYEVVVEGVYGTNPLGVIAVDDFVFDSFECSYRPMTTPTIPPSTTPSITRATTAQPQTTAQGNCDFSVNYCDWRKGDHNTVEWTISAGRYLYLAINSDHTTSRGFLHSKSFPATSNRCISFLYLMNGPHIGQLELWLAKPTGTAKIWKLNGDQKTSTWSLAQVSYKSSAQYELFFDGTNNNLQRKHIAIRDIRFEDKSCTIMPPQANPNVLHVRPIG